MKWLSHYINKYFDSRHKDINAELENSRLSIKQNQEFLKTIKATIDGEEFWFTCECEKRPKEIKKNELAVKLSNNSVTHCQL